MDEFSTQGCTSGAHGGHAAVTTTTAPYSYCVRAISPGARRVRHPRLGECGRSSSRQDQQQAGAAAGHHFTIRALSRGMVW